MKKKITVDLRDMVNAKYTYFLILAGSLVGPVALSFDRKVNFKSYWKRVLLAGILPALFFIVWDIYFTRAGVWNFSADRITGIKLINLPIEEALFFLVVPFCCLFIYVCIRIYFPRFNFKDRAETVLKILSAFFLIVGLVMSDRMYTSWTMLLCSAFLATMFLIPKWFRKFRADYFLASYLIILVPFLIVNGLLTAIPVVNYNDLENLGIRLYTIPIEDSVYGMLLILMNVVLFERSGGVSNE